MQKPRVTLLVLRVADIERAAEFYGLLGFQLERHTHGTGLPHYAAESDGFVFELYPATPAQGVSSSVRVGFAVTNVREAAASLSAVPGAKLATPPKDSEWGYCAVVVDPDGHRIELHASHHGIVSP